MDDVVWKLFWTGLAIVLLVWLFGPVIEVAPRFVFKLAMGMAGIGAALWAISAIALIWVH